MTSSLPEQPDRSEQLEQQEKDELPEQQPVAEPPLTGDPAVDEALGRLHDSAAAGDLDAQSDAGEAVHRALQDRLGDLGGD
ncbi:MAG: hypothetical protein ABIW80_01305 [Lapillicoccus sp.]